MDSIIKIENLQKKNPRFGNKPDDREFLLNNFSAEFAFGKTSLIVGKNGSGKSTLLNCISGLMPFENGKVTVTGESIKYELKKNTTAPTISNRHKLGVIFQQKALWEQYNVLDNIMQPLINIDGKKNKSKIEAKAIALLKRLNVKSDIFYNYPNQISGGEQRKVAVARTLITDPEILLIDELEANLDLEALEVILSVLRDDFLLVNDDKNNSQAKNRSLIIISHRIDLIELKFAPEYFLLSENTGELLVHAKSFNELKTSKQDDPQIAKFIKNVIDPARSQWYFGTFCLQTAKEISKLIVEDSDSKMDEALMLQKVGEKLFELITKFEPEEGHFLMIVTREKKDQGEEYNRIRCIELTKGIKDLKLDGKDIKQLCKKIKTITPNPTDGNEVFTELITNYKNILCSQICEFNDDNSAIENAMKHSNVIHYEATRFHEPIYGCKKVLPKKQGNEPSIELCKGTETVYLVTIKDEDEVLGVISIDTTSKELWSNTIMEQFVVVANMAAIAIKQSKKNSKQKNE